MFIPVLLASALIVLSACGRSEQEPVMQLLTLEELTPIFGDAAQGGSGIADVSQTEYEILITYNFDNLDLPEFDEELGFDLAPKIIKFHDTLPHPDRMVFNVRIPDESEEGWRPYVSFMLTDKIIEETEWTDLMQRNLLQVAMDVKYDDE
jgi:hypothetical protein